MYSGSAQSNVQQKNSIMGMHKQIKKIWYVGHAQSTLKQKLIGIMGMHNHIFKNKWYGGHAQSVFLTLVLWACTINKKKKYAGHA